MENINSTHEIQPKGIFQRIKNMLLTPKNEWNVIASEPADIGKILINYFIPLLLIPTIAQILGWGLIGKSVGVLGYSVTIKGWNIGLVNGISTFITSIAAVFVIAFIIDLLAPSFKSEKNLNRSFQLSAYSYTPSMVAGIFYIIPSLSILVILAGIYSLVLFYLGLQPLKATPKESQVSYFIVIIIVTILAFLLVGFLIGLITAPFISKSYGF